MRDKMQSKGLENCVGILLAGGQSSRFGGGDKCLQPLGGRTLLSRAIERAAPQVGALVLNASGDGARFSGYDLSVVEDSLRGQLGPLAGILTGLEWARGQRSSPRWLASFATDAPFFPKDLVCRLVEEAERQGSNLAVAKCDGYTQPVFAVWSVDLAQDLRTALAQEGVRKVMAWAHRFEPAFVNFEAGSFDPFFNINTQDDLNEAEALIAAGGFDESN